MTTSAANSKNGSVTQTDVDLLVFTHICARQPNHIRIQAKVDKSVKSGFSIRIKLTTSNFKINNIEDKKLYYRVLDLVPCESYIYFRIKDYTDDGKQGTGLNKTVAFSVSLLNNKKDVICTQFAELTPDDKTCVKATEESCPFFDSNKLIAKINGQAEVEDLNELEEEAIQQISGVKRPSFVSNEDVNKKSRVQSSIDKLPDYLVYLQKCVSSIKSDDLVAEIFNKKAEELKTLEKELSEKKKKLDDEVTSFNYKMQNQQNLLGQLENKRQVLEAECVSKRQVLEAEHEIQKKTLETELENRKKSVEAEFSRNMNERAKKQEILLVEQRQTFEKQLVEKEKEMKERIVSDFKSREAEIVRKEQELKKFLETTDLLKNLEKQRASIATKYVFTDENVQVSQSSNSNHNQPIQSRPQIQMAPSREECSNFVSQLSK